MPTIEKQRFGEHLFSKLSEMNCYHSKTAAELDALLPTILDRALKGEL